MRFRKPPSPVTDEHQYTRDRWDYQLADWRREQDAQDRASYRDPDRTGREILFWWRFSLYVLATIGVLYLLVCAIKKEVPFYGPLPHPLLHLLPNPLSTGSPTP